MSELWVDVQKKWVQLVFVCDECTLWEEKQEGPASLKDKKKKRPLSAETKVELSSKP